MIKEGDGTAEEEEINNDLHIEKPSKLDPLEKAGGRKPLRKDLIVQLSSVPEEQKTFAATTQFEPISTEGSDRADTPPPYPKPPLFRPGNRKLIYRQRALIAFGCITFLSSSLDYCTFGTEMSKRSKSC